MRQRPPKDHRFRILGESYGKLAVITASEPAEALTIFLSWFTSPDSPRLERTGETTARYEDGEKVTVAK